MQIRQKIFNRTDMQALYSVSRQNLPNFYKSHAFLSPTISKLSNLKNSPVSLAHPVYTGQTNEI